MSTRSRLNLLGAIGVLIYGAAVGTSLLLYPRFWTSSTMGQDVPWYFMGQALVSGLCASVALLVTIALGLIAKQRLGRGVWGSLVPALLFLSMPVGQGLSVLLFTQGIWGGASSASSHWGSVDEYLYGTTVGGFLALAVVCVVVFHFRRAWNEGAA